MSPDTTVTAEATDLPAEAPEQLEIDLRRRTKAGDTVLKLTFAGARYGLARNKNRVALRYALSPGALSTVYETFRANGFDRIEMVPIPKANPEGSSLRVTAGPGRYSASTLGRNSPTPDKVEAYEACVTAAQGLLPNERGDIVVPVRWDSSMNEHPAAIDLEVGSELLGLAPVEGERPDVDVHLSRVRPVTVVLRHGSPATSTSMNFDPSTDPGIVIAYDIEQASVVMRKAAPSSVTGP